MRSPFVESPSFHLNGPLDGGRRSSRVNVAMLAFALVIAVAASSAVLIAI